MPKRKDQEPSSTEQQLVYQELLDVVSQLKQGIDMCLSATSKLSKQVETIKINVEDNKQVIQTLCKEFQNRKNDTQEGAKTVLTSQDEVCSKLEQKEIYKLL